MVKVINHFSTLHTMVSKNPVGSMTQCCNKLHIFGAPKYVIGLIYAYIVHLFYLLIINDLASVLAVLARVRRFHSTNIHFHHFYIQQCIPWL